MIELRLTSSRGSASGEDGVIGRNATESRAAAGDNYAPCGLKLSVDVARISKIDLPIR